MKNSTRAIAVAILNLVSLMIFKDNMYFISANIFIATYFICSAIEKTKK